MIKDQVVAIIRQHTDQLPDFEAAAAEKMAEEIVLLLLTSIADGMNKALGFEQ